MHVHCVVCTDLRACKEIASSTVNSLAWSGTLVYEVHAILAATSMEDLLWPLCHTCAICNA